jgi:hypothetical protein
VPFPPQDKQSPAPVYTPDYIAKAKKDNSGTVEALAAALQALSPADRARLTALLIDQLPQGTGTR